MCFTVSCMDESDRCVCFSSCCVWTQRYFTIISLNPALTQPCCNYGRESHVDFNVGRGTEFAACFLLFYYVHVSFTSLNIRKVVGGCHLPPKSLHGDYYLEYFLIWIRFISLVSKLNISIIYRLFSTNDMFIK